MIFLAFFSWQISCCKVKNDPVICQTKAICEEDTIVKPGAEKLSQYLPLLKDKRVALLINQTSVVSNAHHDMVPLTDTLRASGVDIRFIMAPEHGLEGKISAGSTVADGQYKEDQALPIYSLYGKNKKPKKEWLDQIDCVVFDIQDVGCRFYTYLSTLYYLLQACGKQQKEVIILDRPNPNDTIDGPILTSSCQSFVGMIPVPLLHGCTLGELALMMVGEKWTEANAPKITVITIDHWRHGQDYSLPIAPSPNLRNDHAIRLYPSLCLFEATDISIGRGTDWPFEVLGHPQMQGPFQFTPQHCQAASHPLQEGITCIGYDLRNTSMPKGFHLKWLIESRRQFSNDSNELSWIKQPTFFDRLAGTEQLREQLAEGLDEEAIRQSWQSDLDRYKSIRKNYLLYE